MTESSNTDQKHDRLTAFLKAFQLGALRRDSAEAANLLIVDTHGAGAPTHLLYRARSTASLPDGAAMCAGAAVDFGGSANPLTVRCLTNCGFHWPTNRNWVACAN